MSNTALLMIDFQRDFCAEGGYSDRFAGLDWVKPIIGPARRLLPREERATSSFTPARATPRTSPTVLP
jgi:nicotinamidase-related amidase